MSKVEQLLSINPENELVFQGPFTSPVCSWITLANKASKVVNFKLKTTVPKRYCVRPNSGQIPVKGSVDVQVVLQPFHFVHGEKNKHKFMIQSVVMPDDAPNFGGDDVWKLVNPDKIMNHKLKCVFELPATAPPPAAPEQQQASGEVFCEPTPMPTNLKTPFPSELQKMASQLSALQEENIALKEEVARWHREGQSAYTYNPPVVQKPSFTNRKVPTRFVVMSVLVAFVAFLLGKYIL